MTTELVELADEMRSVSGAFAEPALVEEWERRLRALASRAGGWTSVKDRLPSTDEIVITHHDYGSVVANPAHPDYGKRSVIRLDRCFNGMFFGDMAGTGTATHWQPLPEPPAAPEPVAVGSALAPGCGDGVAEQGKVDRLVKAMDGKSHMRIDFCD